MNSRLILPLVILAAAAPIVAEDAPERKMPQQIRTLVENLKWKEGRISLGGDVATLTTTRGYRYLDSEDARRVLTDLWKNRTRPTLGMIFPQYRGPMELACYGNSFVPRMIFPQYRGPMEPGWALVINGFDQDGFVKDEDADKLDAGKLLQQLQERQQQANEQSKKDGFQQFEVVKFAVPPRYDKQAKKLYWALDIKNVGGSNHSVNYYVRILGRRGFFVLNAVGSLYDIPEIEAAMPQVLTMVEFNEGNRYADFNPKTDKVATYGIAGLIVGAVAIKLAAKAGILALLGSKFAYILVAIKKFWIIAAAAFAGMFKKIKGLFSRSSE